MVDLKYRLPTKYMVSWIGLGCLVLAALLFRPATFSPLSFELITALAGCLLVASLGQNLVVMGGAVDLSIPAHLTLAAALNVYFVDRMPGIAALLVALAVCGLIGAATGFLVSVLHLNALIVTFAVNAIVAAALVLWLGQSYSSTGAAPQWLQSLAGASLWNVSALLFVALAFAIVVAAILSRTRAGRQLPAVGSNRRAASALGMRVHVVSIASFAMAGVLYAVAGSMLAGLVKFPMAGVGNTYMLATITVVAIAGTSFAGGPSSIASLVASTLLLLTLNQLLALQDLSAGTLYLVQGLILLLAVSIGTLTRLGRPGLRHLTGMLTRDRAARTAHGRSLSSPQLAQTTADRHPDDRSTPETMESH